MSAVGLQIRSLQNLSQLSSFQLILPPSPNRGKPCPQPPPPSSRSSSSSGFGPVEENTPKGVFPSSSPSWSLPTRTATRSSARSATGYAPTCATRTRSRPSTSSPSSSSAAGPRSSWRRLKRWKAFPLLRTKFRSFPKFATPQTPRNAARTSVSRLRLDSPLSSRQPKTASPQTPPEQLCPFPVPSAPVAQPSVTASRPSSPASATWPRALARRSSRSCSSPASGSGSRYCTAY